MILRGSDQAILESFETTEKGKSFTERASTRRVRDGLFFLLLLISRIVDLGREIFTYMDLREAAQEGAA